jgi:membrane associated rhomboid family serine protease
VSASDGTERVKVVQVDVRMLRRAAPFVYVVAILVAVFFGSGATVAAVAAIGGVVLGGLYAVTRPDGRERRRDRNRP